MPPERFKDYNIILASGSPRRAELLAKLDIEFSVSATEGSEDFNDNLSPEEIAKNLASRKSSAVAAHYTAGDVIIGADTIVVCEGRILNKPSDSQQAFEFLTLLSGRSHEVITGVAIHFEGKLYTFATTTEVRFGSMESNDMKYYIDKYKPFDKAGGYGIQEWIGMAGVSEIRGCYYNVMGLPLYDLYTKLKEILKLTY